MCYDRGKEEKRWKSVGWWEILKGEQPGPIKSIPDLEDTGQFGASSTEFALTGPRCRCTRREEEEQ